MTTNAGEMSTTAHSNPQWLLCDGKFHYALYGLQPQRTRGVLSEGNRQDYLRRVGWQGRRRGLGPLGWLIGVPYGPRRHLLCHARQTTAPRRHW